MVFEIFKWSFDFLKMLTGTQSFREKGWTLPHLSRFPLGNALKGCWTGAEYCLKGIEKSLGNAQRLLGTLWEIPKGYRKAAGQCPNTCNQPVGIAGQKTVKVLKGR